MQNSAWIGLLRMMPPALHDNLLLVTRIGQEFTVQNIFRTEDDFVVIRGRMAGTTEAGRVFLIPYAEIHYVGFQKAMKEKDIAAIFSGQFTGTHSSDERIGAVAEQKPESPPPTPSEPAAATAPAAEPELAPPVEVDIKPKPAAKGLLLERVRARLAASAKAKVQ
ncbi:MAG TPA: hypothetical protein VKE94_18155 [Gemmataceae bacterium]|nr:hypothetical protein [Gemmataceae bacterium]